LKRERSDEREMVREEEGNGEDERKGGEDGERRMEMRNGVDGWGIRVSE
jgi:hypothetical protein